jgi:hypothetical protein
MNVEVVQRRLWEQSQQHREFRESGAPLFPVNPYEGRIRNLMDLMHQPQWIAAACDRVLQRSRGKAAGVDRVTASEYQQNRRANLEALRLELKRGTYQPRPLRRVMIPKANGTLRGLGIPCIRDKIVQEAIRMALEPIYEVEFHEHSYGFRPNRSTHHAVLRCQQMMQKRFTWVIEGDVKACFDEISHQAILGCLREKVNDKRFLGLIGRLLKAGVSIDGVFLGFHLRLGIGQGGAHVPKVRVPRNAVTHAVRRLNEAMRWQPTQQSGAARLVRGSAVVTGWAHYYKIAHDFNRVANTVDHYAFWIGVKALCRRYDISMAQCIRKYGRGGHLSIGDSYMLRRAQDVPMSWKQTSPTPYEPGTGCYLDDVDWEAEARQYENGQRPGRMDFKALTLFRDGYRCRHCGTRVTYETSEADHIKPVSSFASYAQATHLLNLQTLCLECHKRKTSAE